MYQRVKRICDFIIALLALIILSPVFLIVGIAIKLESKGPVFFRQNRIGLKSRVFQIYKFRSMYVGAEKDGVYEQKNDKRVTKVGRIIRRTSIDELPQLINMIKGDMSLIGPRPVLTYHPWPYDDYTDEQKKRFTVRPGITGWAQINGRKDVFWERRIEYDIEYVDNLSFRLDLIIFFKTIIKVLAMQNNVNQGETAVKQAGVTETADVTE